MIIDAADLALTKYRLPDKRLRRTSLQTRQ